MKTRTFLLKNVALDFGDQSSVCVDFLGPNANLKKTHISVLVGANGTSKSRLLASLIERMCDYEAHRRPDINQRRQSGSGVFGLICSSLSTISGGRENLGADGGGDLVGDVALPTRILALSNLVMDKFHYPRDDQSGKYFYSYLGVRQATNLTTTGSVERSVGEAVLHMASDAARLNAFQDWVNLVFGGGRELAFLFPRISRREIENFLSRPDKEGYVFERVGRRYGTRRPFSMDDGVVSEAVRQISDLFGFLADHLTEYQLPVGTSRSKSEAFLRIGSLSLEDRRHLSSLIGNFSAASRAGFSAWPSLCVEGDSWIPFSQLSSGEQNLLSVGAKLIAYSQPGCLVVIDEPEVSLNVAWQQQYIDLVLNSLSHAPGSHVVIATHSPHLIASLPNGCASIVLAEKDGWKVKFRTVDATFEGWGSESVLYQVLGIASASSFHFNKDMAAVLRHIQEGGQNRSLIQSFLRRVSKLDYQDSEPLGLVVAEVKKYLESLA
jgi:AAA domain, putative AbiEii toxin, Type IV TA system